MVLTLRKMSLWKFLVVSVFSNNDLWQKTKTWKGQNYTESFLNWKHPLLTVAITRNCLKQPICYLRTILPLITKAIMVNVHWKLWATLCKLYSERTKCVEECSKSDSLHTSKNELMTIFRGFRVFEYALW